VTTPIVELLPVLANYGHRHILVPDSNWRLAGMITQAEAYAQQRRAA
jgi:CBS domain-containing membrane protein